MEETHGIAVMKLSQALKEWAIAIDALETGNTILLLRKGGIREGSRFQVAANPVLLYPTYEHQKPHLLKPEFADRVQTVPSGWHPDPVRIGAWAEITHVFPISEAAGVAALLPLHVWNAQFVLERLSWKPKQPLSVLLLRTYRLSQPQFIPYRTEYGGCKSWIETTAAVDITGSVPVLSDQDYLQRVTEVQKISKAVA